MDSILLLPTECAVNENQSQTENLRWIEYSGIWFNKDISYIYMVHYYASLQMYLTFSCVTILHPKLYLII